MRVSCCTSSDQSYRAPLPGRCHLWCRTAPAQPSQFSASARLSKLRVRPARWFWPGLRSIDEAALSGDDVRLLHVMLDHEGAGTLLMRELEAFVRDGLR